MKKLIVLYDENNERVGETYPRRAKQLIRSGRATWSVDGESLILNMTYDSCPIPKEDDLMSDYYYQNNGTAVAPPPITPGAGESNDLLLYLAKENVAKKKNLVRHVIAYVLVWAVVLTASSVHFVQPQGRNASVEESHTIFGYVQMPDMYWLNELPYHFQQWELPVVNRWEFNNTNFIEVLEARTNDVIMNAGSISPNITVVANTHYARNPFWHFIFGIMAAWGAWILFSGIKVYRKSLRSRPPKAPKPDPVVQEYQRLQALIGEGA
ncbi:MAG: hypothetical protein FWC73_04475 [Defluviitaleaceae bacterium]|nr:hypothetical protein [Defluviitaleaceae bacterium]